MPAPEPEQLTCCRPDQGATSVSTALVPVAASSTHSVPPAQQLPSPDPTFVTQLIASARQLAERRRWPRDRAADANSAYHQHRVFGAGLKTRQTI